MIDISNLKVKEVLESIHAGMLRKANRRKDLNDEIVLENRIFSILCHEYGIEPSRIAERLNMKYDCDMNGSNVIQILKRRRMANPVERKELFSWAGKVAEYFGKAVEGDKEAFDNFEITRRESFMNGVRRHDSQERIVALTVYEKFPELDTYGDMETIHLFGNALAKYFFYDMADAVSEVYDFPQKREVKKKISSLSLEEALKKIERLENALERTNHMLEDLQEEFEEQLEASKIKELADFFTRLNSDKYGFILDELLLVRKGIDELKKADYELPLEINGLLIMVRKLIQFVKDSHIEPILKIHSIREVVASEIEFCHYDGSPFTTPTETKKVKVISPGWVYKDKELQISRPKVREEE